MSYETGFADYPFKHETVILTHRYGLRESAVLERLPADHQPNAGGPVEVRTVPPLGLTVWGKTPEAVDAAVDLIHTTCEQMLAEET